MILISPSLFDYIHYIFYLICIIYSSYLVFKLLTSKDERKVYRLKIQKEISEKTNKVKEKNLNSTFQSRINESGIAYLNAFNYQIVRYLILLFLIGKYLFIPYLNHENVNLPLILIVIVFIITEPKFKYSVINALLRFFTYKRKRVRMIEMFTLFDILKSELNSLNGYQEVNVYNFIKNAQPLLPNIKGTLSKFLSTWKRSPEHAKEIFHQEIGGDSAKTLGEILYKLDYLPKDKAMLLIQEESEVFSYHHFQQEMQKSEKKQVTLFGFFSFTNALLFVWIIVFVFMMVLEQMDGLTL